MNKVETLRRITALPPEARAVLTDVIEVLERRYGSFVPEKKGNRLASLRRDPAIGIWRNRADIKSSVEHVRALRRDSWRGSK